MPAVQFKCMGGSGLYKALAPSQSATKIRTINVVHGEILPRVLSNMIDNRGIGVENKASAGSTTPDWVTRTDKDNQIATVQAFTAALPHFKHIGEEDTNPPVDRIITEEHLTGDTAINDGVDGTSFFAYKDENIFGPLSFIVKGYREFAFQIVLLSRGMPFYAGIFAPELRLDGQNDISVLESADFLPGAWLNGELAEFSAQYATQGSKPMISILENNPYKEVLEKHLMRHFGISRHFPNVSSVACETALLVAGKKAGIEMPYPFALYSANAAKIWDWLPGGFIVDKSGGMAAMIKREKRGFVPVPLFPLLAENLVPGDEPGTYKPQVKWPVVYGGKDTVADIIASMNRWPERDLFFSEMN